MRTIRFLSFILAISTAVYAAEASYAMLTCAKGVRKMSFASDTLFRDMLGGIGGAGFEDTVHYPKAKSRSVTRIEVIVPYDNVRTGVERWTIVHDGNQPTAYILYFVPDGHGGTRFGVKLDDGKS